MTRILGWDVGGAHLKAVLAEEGRILGVWQEPTPIWTGLEHLDRGLAAILGRAGSVDRHAVTMTGELSDVFSDRAEGVERLVAILAASLGDGVSIYAGEAGFLAPAEAAGVVKSVGSANWHASAALAAASIDAALFLDMGSTTTDIVPVAGGGIRARGTTDADRLVAGELVYQGYTRTTLMAVADRVPFGGKLSPVMNEHFATTADVQRIVGILEEADDQHPAADGKEKSVAASRARLARMIGLDAADASEDAWTWLAHAFAEAQVRRIHDATLQVLSRHDVDEDAPVIVAGTGRPVLRRLAARLDRGVVDFSDLFDCPGDMRDAVCRAAPAAALALLAGQS